MKNPKKLFLLALMPLFSSIIFAQEKAVTAPFTKGFNLCSWFEIWSPGIPNLGLYDKTTFENIKELGCDVIRVPIHFEMFIEDDKSYKIKPIIFEYLDKACDWAEELGIHLIIDNHSFNSGKYPNAKKVEEHLSKVWPQIAEHYKNRSNLILYEILNEPQISQQEWEKIQTQTIKHIRSIDKNHTIVVTGADWGSLNALSGMKPYEDKNLIYTFHFYDPFIFTHQGANWTSKEVEDAAGIPFPYNKDKIPLLKGKARGSWVESNLKTTYKKDGTAETLRNQLKKAVDFSNKFNIPVWCGELGVYNLVSPEEDRNTWYKTVGSILQDFGIPFTVWGFDGSFGVFTKGTANIYPYDLNVEVIKGLGMNVPKDAGKQMPEEFGKISLPFELYDDFVSKGVSGNIWGSRKSSFFNETETFKGRFCCQWDDVDRYSSVNFGLSNKKLDFLDSQKDKIAIHLMVKFTQKGQQFQLRFVDTDGQDKLPPWRLIYNIKAENYKLNEWTCIEIPLSQMKESGAWSNDIKKWFNPEGKFTFTRCDSLQFSAEDSAFTGSIYFDDVKLIELN